MNLHVIAYPLLSAEDNEKIQFYRKQHNSLYGIMRPHFTIVFSVPDMQQEDFITEIKKQTQNIDTIKFCLRCTAINKDAFSNNFDAFLIPDEGFGSITRLHDKLYSGRLSKYHRLDISYIPHISIANSTDVLAIKKIVDEWNKEDFSMNGTISSLDIINYENKVITTIEKIDLNI